MINHEIIENSWISWAKKNNRPPLNIAPCTKSNSKGSKCKT